MSLDFKHYVDFADLRNHGRSQEKSHHKEEEVFEENNLLEDISEEEVFVKNNLLEGRGRGL